MKRFISNSTQGLSWCFSFIGAPPFSSTPHARAKLPVNMPFDASSKELFDRILKHKAGQQETAKLTQNGRHV